MFLASVKDTDICFGGLWVRDDIPSAGGINQSKSVRNTSGSGGKLPYWTLFSLRRVLHSARTR